MIYGNFKSINDTSYYVQIDCSTDYEIGSSDEIQFTEDPISITQDVSDTFEHIIKTQCEISLLVKHYIGDSIFTSNDREINVRIYKNSVSDTNLIFSGYIEPQTFNQDFAEEYTEITLNCQDYLCTLENHKYRESEAYDLTKLNADNVTFYSILQDDIFSALDGNFNVYFDQSVKVKDGLSDVFKQCGISELLLLGDEEDDLWTQEEVLTEILQYLNLHIVQFGLNFYVFNWNTVKKQTSIKWINIFDSDTVTNQAINTIEIDKSYYKSDDTQISMADVYNRIIVECDIDDTEDLFTSPLDSDTLTSPYTNKNLFLIENLKGEDEVHTWYCQYENASNWILRYYDKNTSSVKLVTDAVEYDSDGIAINQWKLPYLTQSNTLCPLICSFGKVNQGSASDNSLKSKIDLDNYLCIHVGGSQDKNHSTTTINEWNTISNACNGIVEYNSTTTAGVISPNDPTVTNYIVFGGSIRLVPPYDTTSSGSGYDRREVLASWYKATYPNSSGTAQTASFKSLMPIVDYNQDKYSEEYGTWFYYKDEEGTDTISKIPILVCELKIGNKYCVEVAESDFRWMTQAECDAYTYEDVSGNTLTGIEPTFALGINPAVGDFLLCKDFDIQNTLDTSMNVDAEGTAIPIKSTDKLSGKITFKILSPSYSGWAQQIRKHPTFFRHTKWWTTDLPLMEYVDNIWIKDFECKLYSDNAIMNNIEEKDLIYMTDVANNSIQTKDDITFRFNTALNTQECLEKGVSTSSKLSNVIDMQTNSNVMYVYSKDSSYSDKNKKPEEHYINDYYDEYNSPKLIVETTLDSSKTDYFNHYKFSYFSGKEFYPISIEKNIKYNTTNFKLKEI